MAHPAFYCFQLMKNVSALALLLLAAACSTTPNPTTTETPAAAESSVGARVTKAQAAAIATRHFRSRPDSAVYQLNTLQVIEAGPNWQVLVKRSDRAGLMPDNSAIEVDKQTGAVITIGVK